MIKILVFGTAVVGAGFATANAIANVARGQNPVVAGAAAPNDGRIVASIAQAKVLTALARAKPGGAVKFPPVAGDARRALQLEPLNSVALRLLAMDQENRGRASAAKKFLKLSERVTRRDGTTQLWLIKDAAESRDVRGIFHHSDILLRTHPDAGPSLFPLLNQAVEDPKFRQVAYSHVREKSPWMPDYLSYAAGNTKRPDAVSKLVRMAGGVPESNTRQVTETMLLHRLVETGASEEVLKFFALMKGAKPNIVNGMSFTPTSTDARFAPVAWEALSPNAMVATFDQEPDDRMSFNVVASSGERGIVARKLFALKPGSYSLFQNVTLATTGDNYAFSGWKMRCVDSRQKGPIWQSSGSWYPVGRHVLNGPTIPASCPLQMLELEVAGGLAGKGIELSIANVALRPTNATKAAAAGTKP